MPHYATERRVGHSAPDMFALVADIARYPEFVPFCERLVVRGRQVHGHRTTLVADMTVGYSAIRETFTTRVTLDPEELAIGAEYLEGPFRHLDSQWRFVADGERACLVRFAIDYEFRSRLLAMAMGAAFDRMFRKFVEAFETRADAVYGTAAAGT